MVVALTFILHSFFLLETWSIADPKYNPSPPPNRYLWNLQNPQPSEPIPRIPTSWLYPSSRTLRRREKQTNDGSELSFRSMFPSESSHYSSYYRNRNLYAQKEWGNKKYYSHAPVGSTASSHKSINTKDGSAYYRGRKSDLSNPSSVHVNSQTRSTSYLATTEPSSRSAPATEAFGESFRSNLDTRQGYTTTMEVRGGKTQEKRSKSLKLSPIWGTLDTLTASSENIEYTEGGGIVFPDTPAHTTAESKQSYPNWAHKDKRGNGENRRTTSSIMNDTPLVGLGDLIFKVDTRQNMESSRNKEKVSYLTSKPACNEDGGYCEKVDGYPKEFLNTILKKSLSSNSFRMIFGDAIENETSGGVALRSELDEFESPLCTSIEHTIYPQTAKNKQGKFLFIVNHDDYIQGVRVEKCLRDGQPCQFNGEDPTGYKSHCKQKYIYKKLLALDPDGRAITDTFRLPSCCVCYLQSAFVSDRINAGKPGFLQKSEPEFTKKPVPSESELLTSLSSTTSSSPRINASIINDDISSFEAVDELIITRDESDLKVDSPDSTDEETSTHSIVFE